MEQSSGGIRIFRDSDREWLRIIGCMKKTGMSLKDIRQYIELALQGDDTIETRQRMFTHQRDVLRAQMEELQQTLDRLNAKIERYETVLIPIEKQLGGGPS